jgi:hypothetical protein
VQVNPGSATNAALPYDHNLDLDNMETQEDFTFDLAAIVADVQQDEDMQQQSSQLAPTQMASAAQLVSHITNTSVTKAAPNMPFFHGCKIGNINIVMRK